jgi:D-3-phosphoglycerate dehydrogenase / 2-oxoglutarate reductase
MGVPVVLVAEELAPAALRALGDDFEVRQVDGADRAQLLPALADVDALIVRSATRVDEEALAAAGALRVVARAGVGLDNVDVAAATARGVMVVNAPQSNIVSAAEHAVALLLALARNLPQADASLRAGRWERSRFTGVEIAGKTVGVLGLGRIGALLAERMAAFDVDLVAYDPYVPAARAAALGVRMVPLDELLRVSDFISVHLPRTPETVGLIGERELRLVKPTVRIVNAARGGLVDEAALRQALLDGRVAGAAIDVFATEPCVDSPLLGLRQVVVTPHLGASTAEAQDKAGLAAARSVRLALQGDFVPDAVNVQATGVIDEDVRPALSLVERLGQVLTALSGGLAATLEVHVRGEIASRDVDVLQLAALKGLLSPVVAERVTFVNAPMIAEQLGLEARLVTDEVSDDYRNAVALRATLATGARHSATGTLAGRRQVQKLIEVDGYDVDLALSEHTAFFGYHDRPGVVGKVGQILGAAGVNIAGMQVSRRAAGGEALMALTVDSALPPAELARIAEAISASTARAVDIADR